MPTNPNNPCDFSNISELSLKEQLLSFPEHAEYSADIDLGQISKAKKVCIFALGESAIAGEVVSAYADDYSPIPIPVISDGRIPGWVDSDTAVILISYTGNNDVINKIYRIVNGRRCPVYCLASGGYLERVCKRDNHKFIKVPTGLTPRSATGYELGVLCSLIQKMGICNICDRLKEIIPVMKEYRNSLKLDPRINRLESKLFENTVAIYGSPDLRASFRRWKMSLNSDMGFPAYCGELPEFNHNELVGWANHNQDADDLIIVFLRGKYKSEVLTKIIDKTLEVLEESDRHVIDVNLLGSDPLEKNLYGILLGDYISQEMRSANGCKDTKEWMP